MDHFTGFVIHPADQQVRLARSRHVLHDHDGGEALIKAVTLRLRVCQSCPRLREAWRQGVLKCLFVGVPLEAVASIDERADAELARMVADYCRERIAAGREVPPDASRVLDRVGLSADEPSEHEGSRS